MDITQRRISRIARMVRTFTNRSMRREGVGPSELDLLLAVRFHPGITLTEVCRHLELDKGAAARQLASLETKGYIRREPNPNDRRSQLLYATEKGEAIRSSKAHVEEVSTSGLWSRSAGKSGRSSQGCLKFLCGAAGRSGMRNSRM